MFASCSGFATLRYTGPLWILLAELQALEFEEDRVEYEEVEQTTPDGIALMAQLRALKAACDALSPVGRYKVASVSYRKCAFDT